MDTCTSTTLTWRMEDNVFCLSNTGKTLGTNTYAIEKPNQIRDDTHERLHFELLDFIAFWSHPRTLDQPPLTSGARLTKHEENRNQSRVSVVEGRIRVIAHEIAVQPPLPLK